MPQEYAIMERKIKMIWDFRGPVAEKTAMHHALHLKEFASLESLKERISGSTSINEMHAIAYLVVTDAEVSKVKNALKPHRATLYEL